MWERRNRGENRRKRAKYEEKSGVNMGEKCGGKSHILQYKWLEMYFKNNLNKSGQYVFISLKKY